MGCCPPRQCSHHPRHPIGRICAAKEAGVADHRRGTRRCLRATGRVALLRSRCGHKAGADRAVPRGFRQCHTESRKLAQRRARPLSSSHPATQSRLGGATPTAAYRCQRTGAVSRLISRASAADRQHATGGPSGHGVSQPARLCCRTDVP